MNVNQMEYQMKSKTIYQTYTQLAQQFIKAKKLKDNSTKTYNKAKKEILLSINETVTETKERAIKEKEAATFIMPDYGLYLVKGEYMSPALRLNKDLLRQNLARLGYSDDVITELLVKSSKYAAPRLELSVEQTRRSYDKKQLIPSEETSNEEIINTSATLTHAAG